MNTDVLYSNIPQKTFSRVQLFETARKMDSSFKDSQLKFYISAMLKENLIVRIGHGIYSKTENSKPVFKYTPSDDACKIKDIIKSEYPLINFCIWDLTILNEFVNHLIGHNHIFVEVEKDGTGFVHELLNEKIENRILINPDSKELERYSIDNDVYLINAITEAPVSEGGDTSIEKLAVDLFTNKILSKLISRGDYPQALEEMFNKYQINENKLLRYASRRGKKNEIMNFISEKTNVELFNAGTIK